METYYPEIEDIRSELQKLSEEISILFQLLMVEHKEYERADFYSEQLKSYYLTKYFGDKSLAHKFAEKLLNSGLRKVALELNRDIRVLGAEHSDAIVSRLKKKYFSEIYGRSVEEMGEWADYLEEHLLNFEFESDDDISLSFERSFSEKTLTFIFNANIFRKSNSGIFKTDQLILEFEVDLFNLQVKASYAGKFDLRKADFLSDYESDQDLFEFFKTHIKFAFR